MRTPVLIATDADNTLWDTDVVYAMAQLRLLEGLERTLGRQIEGTHDRLAFVRSVDQELARLHGFNLRYPTRFLAIGLELAIKGMSPSSAAAECLRQPDAALHHLDQLLSEFGESISHGVPTLREGVSDGLAELHSRAAMIVIATEGSPERCRRLLVHHGLDHVVHSLVHGVKNVQFYLDIAAQYPQALRFMVGDQLDRDIGPAKEAGFQTVHFPGGFKPSWTSATEHIKPHFAISDFREMLAVIEPAGLEATTVGPRAR